MTTSQKAALSLLISVVLFGGFAALAFTGLFDFIEARFYDPSITSSIHRDIERNAGIIDRFFTDIQTRFSETLRVPAVRRSFLPNQSAEDIFERSRIYGLFIESLGGVHWVRFIDSGGGRLHYSSYPADILYQDRLSISYRNFNEQGITYEEIAVNDGEEPKYTFHGESDRILFSFPFYDSFEVYRGTAVFSLSVKVVADYLINEGRIKVGQDITVISRPAGLLSGMSTAVEKALSPQVSSIWNEGGLRTARLISPDSDLSLSLITVKTPHGFLVGRLINEDLFSFPQTLKIILLLSFFLTVYLTAFLLFNLRQDPVTIVQNRMKQLQISLIEQFYEQKGEMDWARWSRDIELRRDEINAQLKKGIKTASGRIQDEDIDVLIDKSWDELLSIMGSRKETGPDEEKLESILHRILAALPGTASAQVTGSPIHVQPANAVAEKPAVEELVEEVEAVEEVEELAEILEPSETEAAPADDTEAIETEDAGALVSASLHKGAFGDELQRVASKIEFDSVSGSEDTDDEAIEEDLEIVSPFSTMLSGFSSSDEGDDILPEEEAPENEVGDKKG
jgi:hypothetical protein